MERVAGDWNPRSIRADGPNREATSLPSPPGLVIRTRPAWPRPLHAGPLPDRRGFAEVSLGSRRGCSRLCRWDPNAVVHPEYGDFPMSESHVDVVRAWKDSEYRAGLSEAERAALPENPA